MKYRLRRALLALRFFDFNFCNFALHKLRLHYHNVKLNRITATTTATAITLCESRPKNEKKKRFHRNARIDRAYGDAVEHSLFALA